MNLVNTVSYSCVYILCEQQIHVLSDMFLVLQFAIFRVFFSIWLLHLSQGSLLQVSFLNGKKKENISHGHSDSKN